MTEAQSMAKLRAAVQLAAVNHLLRRGETPEITSRGKFSVRSLAVVERGFYREAVGYWSRLTYHFEKND